MDSILILAGDKRQDKLFDILKDKASDCIRENISPKKALKEAEKCSILVLPVPLSSDGEYVYSNNPEFRMNLSDILSVLTEDKTVIAGGIGEKIRNELSEKGVEFYDMLDSEYFIGYNAFLTAQGALKLLFDNTESLVTGKKLLITGFGRVSEALSMSLRGIGADVYIIARKPEQLLRAQCLGLKTVNLSAKSSVICMFDYIFNTVPAQIFSENDIYRMRDDAVYFELASKPFGADKECFGKYSKKYVSGGGLPGRFLSESAARIMADFIINTVKERVL